MTNPLLLVSAGLVVLGLGEIAALIGILFRYAIPRAPVVFHVLLAPPMLICAAVCFALAGMALDGDTVVFGLDALALLVIFFFCEGFWIWGLVGYAVYHQVRGRRCPA